MVEGQYVFYITFVTCICITLIYALLIYKLTGLLVWASVIGTGVGILALAYMLQKHNRKNKGKKKAAGTVDKNAKQLEIAVYVLYGVGVCFFIALCCLWHNLSIAIAVLKTAAVIVMRNCRMLCMPFFSSLLIVGWMMLWIWMFILLVSCGEITQPTAGSQYKTVTFNERQNTMMWIQLFAFFWIMEFI